MKPTKLKLNSLLCINAHTYTHVCGKLRINSQAKSKSQQK